MIKRILAFILIGLAFWIPQGAQAANSTPLVFRLTSANGNPGDFWVFSSPDKPLKQITNWGYNEDLIVSPDGQRIAYRSYAKVAVDAITKNGRASGFVPETIWLINPISGDASRIADQPPDISYLQAGKPPKHITRARPGWSPDGASLAWGEQVVNDTQTKSRIAIYNVAAKTTKFIDIPDQFGILAGVSVAWGKPGIAFTSQTADDGGQTAHLILLDPSGKKLLDKPLAARFDTDTLIWVTNDGKDYLTSTYANFLFDPVSGEETAFEGDLEIYNPTNDQSLTFIGTPSETSVQDWRIVVPGAKPLKIPDLDLPVTKQAAAISADGQQGAFIASEVAYLFKDGKTTALKLNGKPAEVAWGPIAWRVKPAP